MAAPTTRPPGKGFTTPRAERWVMAAALITAAVYTVRRLVEGETSPAPATSAAREFLGQGSPPNFAQWIIAWGTGFTGLALLALALPELAGALATFVVLATFLESGSQLATDIGLLERGAGILSPGNTPLPTPTTTTGAAGPLAPAPSTFAKALKPNLSIGKAKGSPSKDSVNKAAAAEGLHYDPASGQYVP